jgi:ABC-type glycerol-3-phosphate transport system substrate-binding protein
MVLGLASALVFGILTPSYATTTITIWTYGDVIDKTLVNLYESKHPGINIRAINQGSPAAVKQKFQLYKNSRSVADVIVYETDDAGYFRHYGSLFKNLNNYPGASSLSGYYLSWRWNQGVAENGNLIGLPTDVGGLAVAYRKDLFAKAGLPTSPSKVGKLWKASSTTASLLVSNSKMLQLQRAIAKSRVSSIAPEQFLRLHSIKVQRSFIQVVALHLKIAN